MRLNGTGDAIDDYEYPATTGELVEEYGEYTSEFQHGSETLGEVLARLEGETYGGPAEVREAVVSAVSHGAVGRRHYSDRDQLTPGERGPPPLSF